MTRARTYHCRQADCPNSYTDVLGGDAAFGSNYSGADCVPCYFAALMLSQNQTPAQVEARPELFEQMSSYLERTGWTWEDVKASYEREPVMM
jgi:hypothetical protein